MILRHFEGLILESKVEEIFLTPREQASNFGFAIWKARPRLMSVSHQHNEIEVNFVTAGSLTYIHGGKRVRIDEGEMAVFWAARLHQLVEMPSETYFYGLTVPLSWFLGWDLPTDFTRPLLQGELLRPPFEEPVSSLRHQLTHWAEDLTLDSAARRRVMLLEIEAWFHRVALSLGGLATHQGMGRHSASPKGPMQKVEEMARYISEHYTDPLTVTDVAKAANLHPNYAVRLFRDSTGSTLVDFITKQRIAHAQLYLATTESNVLDIALEAGFGSASRFYAVFKRELGISPTEYKAMIRSPR